ncbi:astacin, partial [Ostertagia ostertagi]
MQNRSKAAQKVQAALMNTIKTSGHELEGLAQLLWIDGVNYFFDDSVSDQTKNAFKDAANQWESYTCINFTENPSQYLAFRVANNNLISAKDRVKVAELSGCYSTVGKEGGEQVLSLGNGCAQGFIAAHEIGHTLGFIHTHSRSDRDNFIKVNYDVLQ